jgi:hypothetical protein
VPELGVRERPPSTLRNVDGRPLGGLEVGDVDGEPLGGCWRLVRQQPPPKLKTLDPAAATSEVEDDDGRPPGGCWRQDPTAVTIEVGDVDGGPLGVLAARFDNGHHRS